MSKRNRELYFEFRWWLCLCLVDVICGIVTDRLPIFRVGDGGITAETLDDARENDHSYSENTNHFIEGDVALDQVIFMVVVILRILARLVDHLEERLLVVLLVDRHRKLESHHVRAAVGQLLQMRRNRDLALFRVLDRKLGDCLDSQLELLKVTVDLVRHAVVVMIELNTCLLVETDRESLDTLTDLLRKQEIFTLLLHVVTHELKLVLHLSQIVNHEIGTTERLSK